MAGRFPEIEQVIVALPEDIAPDGEILVWADGLLEDQGREIRGPASILRLPRVRRWRRDPTPAGADDSATVQQRLPSPA